MEKIKQIDLRNVVFSEGALLDGLGLFRGFDKQINALSTNERLWYIKEAIGNNIRKILCLSCPDGGKLFRMGIEYPNFRVTYSFKSDNVDIDQRAKRTLVKLGAKLVRSSVVRNAEMSFGLLMEGGLTCLIGLEDHDVAINQMLTNLSSLRDEYIDAIMWDESRLVEDDYEHITKQKISFELNFPSLQDIVSATKSGADISLVVKDGVIYYTSTLRTKVRGIAISTLTNNYWINDERDAIYQVNQLDMMRFIETYVHLSPMSKDELTAYKNERPIYMGVNELGEVTIQFEYMPPFEGVTSKMYVQPSTYYVPKRDLKMSDISFVKSEVRVDRAVLEILEEDYDFDSLPSGYAEVLSRWSEAIVYTTTKPTINTIFSKYVTQMTKEGKEITEEDYEVFTTLTSNP